LHSRIGCISHKNCSNLEGGVIIDWDEEDSYPDRQDNEKLMILTLPFIHDLSKISPNKNFSSFSKNNGYVQHEFPDLISLERKHS
jgi:hypothetical protein